MFLQNIRHGIYTPIGNNQQQTYLDCFDTKNIHRISRIFQIQGKIESGFAAQAGQTFDVLVLGATWRGKHKSRNIKQL